MKFNENISKNRKNIIEATKKLICFKSIQAEGEPGMPFGKGMNDALEFVLDIAKDMGFKVKNFDGYCGYAEYGEGDTYIGLFGHVDIYGSESFAWKYGLYDGAEDDGRIYGNGAIDKGSLIALLYAFNAVKEMAPNIKKRVRLFVGTDEGKRYSDIKRYLKEEKPPITGFTSDGYFPAVYAEKGLSLFDYVKEIKQTGKERVAYIKGGVAENIVPGYCKAKIITDRKEEIVAELRSFANRERVDLTAKIEKDGVLLESFGVEYHCMAIERGVNSIMQMIKFLTHIGVEDEELNKTLKFFNEKLGSEIYGESLGISIEDSFSGRLTFNLGYLDYDGESLHIRCDCRFPVICDFEVTSGIIKDAFESIGLREQEYRFWNPTYMPRNHFLIKTLLAAYRKVTGDMSEPVVCSCISYATEMPNVAAFGMLFPGEREVTYQANEYLDIENMIKAAEIYAEAIYMLASK